MHIDELEPDTLWDYYRRGYDCLIRSGIYFRQIVRPALSHVYFQRAMPLLMTYARANHNDEDLPPDFGSQLEVCPLTPRDLLHLDYAICLGYAEAQGEDPQTLADSPVMDWPGLGGANGVFIASDALMISEIEGLDTDLEEQDAEDSQEEEEGSKPPFNL
jgi:hypothetical protein